MYAVGTRCGFDLSAIEQDFSQISKYSNEETIYRLGSLVCDVSCNVLRGFSRNFKVIEERRIAHGSSSIDLSRGERTSLSGHSDGGDRSKIDESRQVRDYTWEHQCFMKMLSILQGSQIFLSTSEIPISLKIREQ